MSARPWPRPRCGRRRWSSFFAGEGDQGVGLLEVEFALSRLDRGHLHAVLGSDAAELLEDQLPLGGRVIVRHPPAEGDTHDEPASELRLQRGRGVRLDVSGKALPIDPQGDREQQAASGDERHEEVPIGLCSGRPGADQTSPVPAFPGRGRLASLSAHQFAPATGAPESDQVSERQGQTRFRSAGVTECRGQTSDAGVRPGFWFLCWVPAGRNHKPGRPR